MAEKINGYASSTQVLTGDIQYYLCVASSPGACSAPCSNPPSREEIERGVNILVTQCGRDQSQKNFEILLMSVGMRAMPVFFTDPQPVPEICEYDPALCGEGYIWKFAVERGEQFQNNSRRGTPGPVGLLIDEIDGVILPSGVRLTTIKSKDRPINITFQKYDI